MEVQVNHLINLAGWNDVISVSLSPMDQKENCAPQVTSSCLAIITTIIIIIIIIIIITILMIIIMRITIIVII